MMEKLAYLFEKREKDPCFFLKIMGFKVTEQQKVLLIKVLFHKGK